MIQIAARPAAPPAPAAADAMAEAMPGAAAEAQDSPGFAAMLGEALGTGEARPDPAGAITAADALAVNGKPDGKTLPDAPAGLPPAILPPLPQPPALPLAAPAQPAEPPSLPRAALRSARPVAVETARAPSAESAPPLTLTLPAATSADLPALRLAPSADAPTLPAPEPQANGPAPATAPAASPAMPRPHDLAALIDRLVEARQAAAPAAVEASLAHGVFGRVTLTFAQDAAGLTVSLTSRDPEFAPAVQAAMQADPRPVTPAEAGGNAAMLSNGREQGREQGRDQAREQGHGQRREGEAFGRRQSDPASTPSGDGQPQRRGLFA